MLANLVQKESPTPRFNFMCFFERFISVFNVYLSVCGYVAVSVHRGPRPWVFPGAGSGGGLAVVSLLIEVLGAKCRASV